MNTLRFEDIKFRIVTREKVFGTRNEIIFTTMRTQRANKALGYIDGRGSRKGGAKTACQLVTIVNVGGTAINPQNGAQI